MLPCARRGPDVTTLAKGWNEKNKQAGFRRPQAVRVQRDRRLAIAEAIGAAGAQDIVLIAGKGHESYQEVDGVRMPFDDFAVAAGYLQEAA